MEKKRVLVIEDDLPIQEVLKELLEDEGLDVHCSSNGEEALQWLYLQLSSPTPQLPHIILLDLMMPIIDGATFWNMQQQDPQISHIPVILMSAQGDLAKKGMAMGEITTVKKPFELEEFLDILSRHLNGKILVESLNIIYKF